ncbi:TPA: TonB family protein [Stenotrophomonas maltophilia]|nr:TonB family protein [Stenotrophomonas maltophilia]HDS1044339.1 TonB family protein [Stenotrophomonas maltophilia]
MFCYRAARLELAMRSAAVRLASGATLADAVVETSSGWAVLDEAALVAVRKWKYTAARKNGVRVPGQVRIPVSFKQP